MKDINKAIEERKAFYNKFKKGFDTKTCYCLADTDMQDVKDTSWKGEYIYLHIFETDNTKTQLFYLQATDKKLYFVIENDIADEFLQIPEGIEIQKKEVWKARKFAQHPDYTNSKYIKEMDNSSYTDGKIRASVRVSTKIYCDKKEAVKLAKAIRTAYKAYHSTKKADSKKEEEKA